MLRLGTPASKALRRPNPAAAPSRPASWPLSWGSTWPAQTPRRAWIVRGRPAFSPIPWKPAFSAGLSAAFSAGFAASLPPASLPASLPAASLPPESLASTAGALSSFAALGLRPIRQIFLVVLVRL